MVFYTAFYIFIILCQIDSKPFSLYPYYRQEHSFEKILSFSVYFIIDGELQTSESHRSADNMHTRA